MRQLIKNYGIGQRSKPIISLCSSFEFFGNKDDKDAISFNQWLRDQEEKRPMEKKMYYTTPN